MLKSHFPGIFGEKLSLFSLKIHKILFFVTLTSLKRHCDVKRKATDTFFITEKRRLIVSSCTKIIRIETCSFCAQLDTKPNFHSCSAFQYVVDSWHVYIFKKMMSSNRVLRNWYSLRVQCLIPHVFRKRPQINKQTHPNTRKEQYIWVLKVQPLYHVCLKMKANEDVINWPLNFFLFPDFTISNCNGKNIKYMHHILTYPVFISKIMHK